MTIRRFDPARGPGEVVATVASGADFAPSPDGGRIAVASLSARTLELVELASGEKTTLATGRLFQTVAWARDGSLVYASALAGEGRPTSLLTVDLAGRVSDLWRAEDGGWLAGPEVSPDGRWLAFDHRPIGLDVWLLELP